MCMHKHFTLVCRLASFTRRVQIGAKLITMQRSREHAFWFLQLQKVVKCLYLILFKGNCGGWPGIITTKERFN